jgi:hypothetical protein
MRKKLLWLFNKKVSEATSMSTWKGAGRGGTTQLNEPPTQPSPPDISASKLVKLRRLAFYNAKTDTDYAPALVKSETSDMPSNKGGACASCERIRWRRIASEQDKSTPELRTRLHVSSEIASAKALRMLSMNIPALLYFPAI